MCQFQIRPRQGWRRTLGEESRVAKMSAAVENGVDASRKSRGGVFSEAFAKRAQPLEEGESVDRYPPVWSLQGLRGLPACRLGEDKHRVCAHKFQVLRVRAKLLPEIRGTYASLS